MVKYGEGILIDGSPVTFYQFPFCIIMASHDYAWQAIFVSCVFFLFFRTPSAEITKRNLTKLRHMSGSSAMYDLWRYSQTLLRKNALKRGIPTRQHKFDQ